MHHKKNISEVFCSQCYIVWKNSIVMSNLKFAIWKCFVSLEAFRSYRPFRFQTFLFNSSRKLPSHYRKFWVSRVGWVFPTRPDCPVIVGNLIKHPRCSVMKYMELIVGSNLKNLKYRFHVSFPQRSSAGCPDNPLSCNSSRQLGKLKKEQIKF